MEAIAGLGIIVVIFGLIIAVLWIAVPFLIIGTNSRIDRLVKLIRAQHETPDTKTHIRCPYCRELARKDATKCPHCTSDLTPTP